MGCETNFYQYEGLLVQSLAPIVLKILEEKKKVLIFSEDERQLKELDNSLWSYGRNKFIPHITIFDKGFDLIRQPVLLTNKEENSNCANYLIFLSETKQDFISNFDRAFYFYDNSSLDSANKLSQELSPKNSYKKEGGKWVKI